jgi:hypothetical protein
MGRGEHPWKNHHKKVKSKNSKVKNCNQPDFSGSFTFYFFLLTLKNCILGVVTGILLDFYLTVRNRKIKKLKHTGN